MLKRARNQTFSNPLKRGSVIEANSKPKVIKKTVNFQNNTIAEQKVDADMKDELQCPVCTEFCTRPRECIACGRVFCAPCIAHLNSCPLCRKEPFVSRDSRLASRLVNNIRVKCVQCAALVVRSRLEEHNKTCEKRLRKCSFENCDFFATGEKEAEVHLKAVHMDEMCENFENLFQLIFPGTFSFISGNNVEFLERGKVIILNSMNAQKECFGLTSKLCINKKQLISIKFQGIHVKLPRIEVGISREEDGNQYKAFLCVSLLVERQSVSIKFYGNKTEKVLSKQAFPFPKKPSALPEFGVEVNTVFRTIRFLISGEQVHDGDLPIPWASDIIEDMKFFVQLFDPGDCVRIID